MKAINPNKMNAPANIKRLNATEACQKYQGVKFRIKWIYTSNLQIKSKIYVQT